MNRKYFIAPLFFAWVTLLLGACKPTPEIQPNGHTVRIGVIVPLTPSGRNQTGRGLPGIHVAHELQPYLNDGTEIRLIIEETGNEAGENESAFRKLVAADVVAVLVLTNSPEVIEIAQVADHFKIPIIATIATYPNITGYSQWVNQLCLNDDFQATVAALFARDEMLLDRAAVFVNPTNAHSDYLGRKFDWKFQSVGGKVTDIIPVDTVKEIDAALVQIREHNPEILYVAIGAKQVLSILESLRELNWDPLIMGTDGLLANILNFDHQNVIPVEGILATDFISDGIPLTAWGTLIIERYRERYGKNISSFNGLAAEGYALLINAINRCDSPKDRQCILRKIRDTQNFEGLMTKISIGSDGKAQRPLFMNRISEESMHFVVKIY